MRFFDAHCHLHDGHDAAALSGRICRFHQAGGLYMVCCGTRPADWPAVGAATARYPGVLAAYGLHPWFAAADAQGKWLAELERLLVGDTEAGVGEIGLDGAIAPRHDTQQRGVFIQQLRLARHLDRVAVVHCIRAWGALLPAMDEVGRLARGVVMHAYSGSVEMITPLARRGAYFSFTAEAVLRGGLWKRACLKAVPSDRLLLETDVSPPVPPAGGGEGPVGTDIGATVAVVASCLGVPVGQLAAQTFENAVRVFRPAAQG